MLEKVIISHLGNNQFVVYDECHRIDLFNFFFEPALCRFKLEKGCEKFTSLEEMLKTGLENEEEMLRTKLNMINDIMKNKEIAK